MPEAEEPRDPEESSSHIEFVPAKQLPTDKKVIRVEQPGEVVWLICEGEMTESLRQEINDILAHVTHNGLQVQRWDGEQPPHPHC